MNRWDKIKETVSGTKQDAADRLSQKKKLSRRSKIRSEMSSQDASPNSDRDEFGQPLYQGTMTLPSMNSTAKRAFNALVQQGTQDSGEIVIPNNLKGQKASSQPRVLPQTESKKDHLFIRGIQLSKDTTTGNWFFGEIETNQGTFALGAEHNAKLNQKMLKDFALYLKDIFEEDLVQYLDLDKDDV